MNTLPAIAMLELDSIAVGTRVADAMIKRAPVREIRIERYNPVSIWCWLAARLRPSKRPISKAFAKAAIPC